MVSRPLFVVSILEFVMPTVKGKKYPYTKAGKALAKKAAKKKGKR